MASVDPRLPFSRRIARFLGALAGLWLLGALILILEFPWDFKPTPLNWLILLGLGPPAALLSAFVGEVIGALISRIAGRSRLRPATLIALWFIAVSALVFAPVGCEVAREMRDQREWQNRRERSTQIAPPNKALQRTGAPWLQT